MRILVSACLLGMNCRYCGGGELDGRIAALAARHSLIPVCPEQLGGLPTPRPSAERRGARVITRDERDLTTAFTKGAEQALYLAQLYGCQIAILKANSPSCGSGQRYDGTFSGKLVPGDGLTAALLKQNELTILSEQDDLMSLL